MSPEPSELLILISILIVFVVIAFTWLLYLPKSRDHFDTPKNLAWKLLEELLTDQQKEQAKKTGKIVECGKTGYYIIPLRNGFVEFVPIMGLSSFIRRLRQHNLRFFVQSYFEGQICLSYTANAGPWYDAVASFILFIRSDNEAELFRQGNWAPKLTERR